ncbi:hybrid sensor histidine kinase/response regulator [Deferrisoma camini]|uniref:hybrid sensor histidine kinase/response regulator n=1 Tax=Deferrisoma camini TaxID=1035120 RepID=UPI00046D2520|nr:hybrid sensor histidine kinase/response regulator [Deferrisoma camini]
MTILDDETLQMYVEESLDHLEDIESDLLAIEQAGAGADEELVNKVFRAAHSIKGGAGFLGLTAINQLAHKLENVLGLFRSKELVPNPDVINLLLQGFDRLRDLLQDVDGGRDADVSELVVALEGLTTANVPEERKPTVSERVQVVLDGRGPVFTVSRFELEQATKGGKNLYVFEYDLIHDVQRQGRSPLTVLQELEDGGVILDAKVDLGVVGGLDSEALPRALPFLVLYATIVGTDIASGVFDLPEERIHVLGEANLQDAPPEPVAPEKEPTTLVATPAAAPDPAPAAPQDPGPSHPDPKPAPQGETARSKDHGRPAETSIRVHVSLLENLMTLAGELVLSRNQLLQAVTTGAAGVDRIAQRIDLITSELQETIMLTRMQPVGKIFGKFPRVVRDLARKLGKEVELEVEGNEVELDKTIIEGLNDPLTHLVRNAVDHGLETPSERLAAGKPAKGRVSLRAFHEAGHVNIEISDDGRGIDAEKIVAKAIEKGLVGAEQARAMSEKEKVGLIFLPGFSTAEQVTDVSGRGVGMDVVKTNLDKLGGVVDIDSAPGRGTTVRIKLPLTLAIIPSQIVAAGGQAFAIPQVNMDELLRIPASQVKERIEIVGDAEVVRLRDRLLPLVRLADVLGLSPKYRDPATGEEREDRRRSLADRRGRRLSLDDPGTDPDEAASQHEDRRGGPDRRTASAVNIVVANAGAFQYGLVVDELLDAEEIVVKPLGRHLKGCGCYAGATIMGSGRVALILDVPGVARLAQLTSVEGSARAAEVKQQARRGAVGEEHLLLFRYAPTERFALPLDVVQRIERVKRDDIATVGGRRVLQYKGGILPLLALDDVAQVGVPDEDAEPVVLVVRLPGRSAGLLATGPVDAYQGRIEVDRETLVQAGIAGSTVIEGETVLVVDVVDVARRSYPDWFQAYEAEETDAREGATLLVAEDSAFFRGQVAGFFREAGYAVLEAEDGQEAWDILCREGERIDAVVTDIEMPNMDGLALTRKIRADERFRHLPVVALTTLAEDEDIARGREAGVTDYQVKLDRDELLASVARILRTEEYA